MSSPRLQLNGITKRYPAVVANSEVSLTWPLTLDNFFLESRTNLTDPWQLSPLAPTYLTNSQSVTLTLAGQRFFRLMRPR